ncbi:hypothetical protein C8D91_2107 [Marinicella litoralis]|uniref:Uncharacterized protein n=1 Tax=Marinicella litoralis TaxID=644220 RepID=A0A4R6XN46_9GAMM|nr:hypothetical protein C8D91_2107 [Marinicella litoralis]
MIPLSCFVAGDSLQLKMLQLVKCDAVCQQYIVMFYVRFNPFYMVLIYAFITLF